ncbi:MAG: protein kinase [Candidatus Sumerlaeota bacterium]|nr:protein kinase [Candidatus Sumerlaeota bacterium]
MSGITDKFRKWMSGKSSEDALPAESAIESFAAKSRSKKVEGVIHFALQEIKRALKTPRKDLSPLLKEGGDRLEQLGESRIVLYEAAARAFPDQDDLCLKLSDIYDKAHRDDEAAQSQHRLAMEIRPRQTALRLRLARCMGRAGRHKERIALCQRILNDLDTTAVRPEDPPREIPAIRREATLALADSFVALGSASQQAIQAYRKALSLEPGHVERTVSLGVAYARERQTTKEARLAIGAALELRCDDPLLNAAIAQIESASGDSQAAIRRLRKAISAHPDDPTLLEIIQELGLDLSQVLEPAEPASVAGEPAAPGPAPDVMAAPPPSSAASAVASAPISAPFAPAARESKFEAFERSILQESKALRKSRLAPAAFKQMVAQIVKSGADSPQAIRMLREAIAEEPKNLENRRVLIEAHLRQGETAAALHETLRLLRYDSSGAATIETAARALLAFLSASNELAREGSEWIADILSLGPDIVPVINRAAQIAPNSHALLNLAAVVLTRQLQTGPEDLQLCRRALELGHFDYEVAQFLANEYRRQGRHDERLEILWMAFRAAPPQASAQKSDERFAAQTQCREDLLGALAQQLYEDGADDEEAGRVYREFLAQRPGYGELTLFVARHYYNNERMLQDLDFAFQSAAAMNPDDVNLAITAARLASRRGDCITAQNLLLPFIPNQEKILKFLGDVLSASDQLTEGLIAKLEKLYLQFPETANVILALAFAYLVEGQTDAVAATVYEQARHLRPGDMRFPLMLAQCYSNLLADEEALDAYQQVLRQAPDDPAIITQMARFYTMTRLASVRRGKVGDAEELIRKQTFEVLEKAMGLHSGNPEIQLAYGRALHSAGRCEEALPWIKSAVAAEPRIRPRASACLKDLLRLSSHHAPTHILLTDLLIADGQYHQALEIIRNLYGTPHAPIGDLIDCLDRIATAAAQSSSPMDHPGEIAMEKAVLLKSVGMFQESLEELRAIIQAHPDNDIFRQEYEEVLEMVCRSNKSETLYTELAHHYLATNQIPRAVTFLQARLHEHDESANYRRLLGMAMMRAGHLDLARREFKRLPLHESLKPALYDLANEYARLRQYERAIETVDRIREVDSAYGDIERLRELWVAQGARLSTGGMVAPLEMAGLNATARRRYELLEEIGRGAFGQVFKAFDHEFDEVVALKILPEEYQIDPGVLERFRLEAKAARRLTHRNIVRIHDIGEEEGRKYISMEFVDGSTLERKLVENPRPPLADICHIIYQIAQALRHAHAQGVIHRDVKPANVLLTSQDVVKLSDFGVAVLRSREASAPTPATGAGAGAGDPRASGVVGTPLYMSPEQVKSRPADARSDLYSLGIVLYEMLAGRPPFPDGNIALRHIQEKPAPPDTPYHELAAIALKCLQKNPAERYQNAAELIQHLKRVAEQEIIRLEEE